MILLSQSILKVVLANIWMMPNLQKILAFVLFFKDYCSPLFLFSLIGVLSEIGNSKPFNL